VASLQMALWGVQIPLWLTRRARTRATAHRQSRRVTAIGGVPLCGWPPLTGDHSVAPGPGCDSAADPCNDQRTSSSDARHAITQFRPTTGSLNNEVLRCLAANRTADRTFWGAWFSAGPDPDSHVRSLTSIRTVPLTKWRARRYR